jgi:hypothetical protein
VDGFNNSRHVKYKSTPEELTEYFENHFVYMCGEDEESGKQRENQEKEEPEMRTLIAAVLAVMLTVSLVSTAEAGDEFERGFRTELGAISARAAVGLGIGLVGGIVHSGPHYAPYPEPIYVKRTIYVKPVPRWRPHRHHRFHRHDHHRHFKPRHHVRHAPRRHCR